MNTNKKHGENIPKTMTGVIRQQALSLVLKQEGEWLRLINRSTTLSAIVVNDLTQSIAARSALLAQLVKAHEVIDELLATHDFLSAQADPRNLQNPVDYLIESHVRACSELNEFLAKNGATITLEAVWIGQRGGVSHE